MKSRFRLAVVGAGRAGMVHARNAAGSVPGAELACVVDADPVVGHQAGAELGVDVFAHLERALAEAAFDGVVITAPTFAHRRTGRAGRRRRQARLLRETHGALPG